MKVLSRKSGGRIVALSLAALLSFAGTVVTNGQGSVQRSPSDTVREFYKAMREKRFRDAFNLSIYRPAIDPLTQAEMDDLKPDFERLAANITDKIQVSGEQISGDVATVFVKMDQGDDKAEAEPINLLRRNGTWIIGDPSNEALVLQSGKEFFFTARIEAHHGDVQSMLQRIGIAQLAYSQQHNGVFGSLAALIQTGLVPKDIESTETTGYRFHVDLAADAKAYTVGAEPALYGRSGKLSFYMDSGGIKSADLKGRPLVAGGSGM
jgi:Domain of unknown function (DUF4878)